MATIINKPQALLGLMLALMLFSGCQQAVQTKIANDLVFNPAQIEVAPGSENSVNVTLTDGADLSKAVFSLNHAADGVSLSFEPSADGKTGELLVELAESKLEGSQKLDIKGTDGTHTWFGTLQLTTSNTAPRTFFVNPSSGNDTNKGSQTKPFKTIAKALSRAKAGDTVKLALGQYSKQSNGENFGEGLGVPNGVRLEGSLAPSGDLSVLVGAGASQDGLLLQGNATLKNLGLSGFRSAIIASAGQQTLTHLDFAQNRVGIIANGTARTTLQGSTLRLNFPDPSTFNPGVVLSDQAQFVMDGGIITGGGANCNINKLGIGADSSGSVTLKNGAILANIAGGALSLVENSKATLVGAFLSNNLPDGCAARPSVRLSGTAALTFDASQVSNSGGKDTIGITTRGTGPLTLEGTAVFGFATGVQLSENVKFGMNRSILEQNQVGLDARGTQNVSITINNSTVQGNFVGIFAPSLRLRGSRVSGNDTGIVGTGQQVLELGNSIEPGGNTIFGNNRTGVTFDTGVIAGGAFAFGNRWNPLTQGSDESGNYEAGARVDGRHPFAHGKNFDLTSPNQAIQLN